MCLMTSKNLYETLTPMASPNHVPVTDCPKMIEYRYMLAAPSLQMAALPIAQMLKAATELNINLTDDYTIGTDSYKGTACVRKFDMVAQVMDSDSLEKLYHCF